MVTVHNWQGFLARFTRFGREPTVARYLDLFDPRGTVQHPGMERPLSGGDIAAFISAALANMPDFGLQPIQWCANAETLFIEARCSGSIGGQRVTWPAIYCLTLRGERVLRGRSYYDRAAVLSHLDPELARRRGEAHAKVLETVDPVGDETTEIGDSGIESRFLASYAANWCAPRSERFPEYFVSSGRLVVPGAPHALGRHEIAAYYGTHLGEIGGLSQQCEAWAFGARLLFVEWRMRGVIDGVPFELGTADRLSLDGERIAEAVSYFDTLALPTPGRSPARRHTMFANLD